MDETKFINFIDTLPESEEKNEMIKYFKQQIKFKTQTLHFKDKFNVIMSFVKFMKTICKLSNVQIYGSFIRNIFEKIFINTSDKGYGDPINHDIDLVIYKSKFDFEDDISNFTDFISLLRIVSNSLTFNFDFYNFKVVDIIETTIKKVDITDESGLNKNLLLDIPHYVIILMKDNFKIKIDMLCYKTSDVFNMWQNEFNINSLTLTDEGIFIKNLISAEKESYNMFETIHSILNRTATCNLPFDTIFYNFELKSRTEKVKIFNQIVWFFANRLKILSLGYKDIFSDNKFLDYEIERVEECSLSGNPAPYIKLKLNCNHYISIMGLAGLVNIRSSEWTEALRCPFCRQDLVFKFIIKSPPKIMIPEQPVKEAIEMDNYEIDEDIFTDENKKYISNLLKNQKLPIDNTNNTEFHLRNERGDRILNPWNRVVLGAEDDRLADTLNRAFISSINANLNVTNNGAFETPWEITDNIQPTLLRRTRRLVGRQRTQEEYMVIANQNMNTNIN